MSIKIENRSINAQYVYFHENRGIINHFGWILTYIVGHSFEIVADQFQELGLKIEKKIILI